jgi:hypothetical protein
VGNQRETRVSRGFSAQPPPIRFNYRLADVVAWRESDLTLDVHPADAQRTASRRSTDGQVQLAFTAASRRSSMATFIWTKAAVAVSRPAPGRWPPGPYRRSLIRRLTTSPSYVREQVAMYRGPGLGQSTYLKRARRFQPAARAIPILTPTIASAGRAEETFIPVRTTKIAAKNIAAERNAAKWRRSRRRTATMPSPRPPNNIPIATT